MREFIISHLVELSKNRLLFSMLLPYLIWVASWFDSSLAVAVAGSTAVYWAYSVHRAMEDR